MKSSSGSARRGQGRRREGQLVSERERKRKREGCKRQTQARPKDWTARALKKQLHRRVNHAMPVMSVASSLTISRDTQRARASECVCLGGVDESEESFLAQVIFFILRNIKTPLISILGIARYLNEKTLFQNKRSSFKSSVCSHHFKWEQTI